MAGTSPRRQDAKWPESRNRYYRSVIGAAGENRREADPVGDVEDPMLSRCAQVGVDQKRTFADLRKSYGKVGGNVAPPFAGAWTDDRQHPLFDPGLGPANQQLGTQRPQLLGARVKRLVSYDEFATDTLVARQHVGKIVLLRDRPAKVVRCNQRQAKRSFTEPDSLGALQLQDALDVPGVELSQLYEDAAELAILTCYDTAGSLDRKDIFLGAHQHSLMWGR